MEPWLSNCLSQPAGSGSARFPVRLSRVPAASSPSLYHLMLQVSLSSNPEVSLHVLRAAPHPLLPLGFFILKVHTLMQTWVYKQEALNAKEASCVHPPMTLPHLDAACIADVPAAGSLQHAIHPLLQPAHPLAHGPPLLLHLLHLLPQLGRDVEELALSVLQVSSSGPEAVPLYLLPLALFAQLGSGAVEGFQLGEDVPHLAFGFVYVLLQVLAQLQQAVGQDVNVVPRCILHMLLLGSNSAWRGPLPLKGESRGHEHHQAKYQGCKCCLHRCWSFHPSNRVLPSLVELNWRAEAPGWTDTALLFYTFPALQCKPCCCLPLASWAEGGVQLLSGFCSSSSSILTIDVRGCVRKEMI